MAFWFGVVKKTVWNVNVKLVVSQPPFLKDWRHFLTSCPKPPPTLIAQIEWNQNDSPLNWLNLIVMTICSFFLFVVFVSRFNLLSFLWLICSIGNFNTVFNSKCFDRIFIWTQLLPSIGLIWLIYSLNFNVRLSLNLVRCKSVCLFSYRLSVKIIHSLDSTVFNCVFDDLVVTSLGWI